MLVVAAGPKKPAFYKELAILARSPILVKPSNGRGCMILYKNDMNIAISSSIPKTAVGCAIFLYEDSLQKSIGELPIKGSLRKSIKQSLSFFSGHEAETLFIPLQAGALKAVLLVGLGKKKDSSTYVFERSVHAGVRGLLHHKITKIACVLPKDRMTSESLAHGAAHVAVAQYDFSVFKKKPQTPKLASCVLVCGGKDEITQSMKDAVKRGLIIGNEINNARDLGNMPGGNLTPTALAEHAQKDGKASGFMVTVFDEKKMKDLGMGGILGVSKGSAEPAKFIICDYTPKNPVSKKPIVLIGKGVTFDTGGLNIKPDLSMYEMHMDMSGGAAVIHAISAIAKLQLPVRVVGLIPAVENMPGNAGYRPGDILTTYSKKTVEVKNTDAEGRIILADALGYAKKYSPDVVLDLATLTGAAVVALGQRTAAVLSPNDQLRNELVAIGEETGDRVWPLPLWNEHKRDVKGDFGDVQNVGKTRYGGAIHGAAFLWEFAPTNKWAHVDIAPTMTTIEDQSLASGSRGAGVYLLVAYVEKYAKTQGTT